MNRLDLGLYDGPVASAPGDTLLALFPSDERPLCGDLGLVDWRLCGELSELAESGYASGELGDAVLVPAGPALKVERVLLYGIGPSRDIRERTFSQALRGAMDKLVAFRSENVVLGLPGAVSFDEEGGSLLRALVRALAAVPDYTALRLVISDYASREPAVERAFGDAFPHARARGVGLSAELVS